MKMSVRVIGLVGALTAVALLSACGNAQSRKARYIQHGQSYFAAGNFDKARVEFRNAAQIDPKDAEVRFLLGEVAERTNDTREALGQYGSAVIEDPKLAKARAALARIYVYGGAPERAVKLLEPGLVTDPHNPQLLTARGAARQQLGNAQGALEDAHEAFRLAPDDPYAVALLASLYRNRSDFPQAIAVTESGLQKLPKDVNLRVILADLYSSNHQPEQAQAQLSQIVELEPTVLAHRYRLAKFFLTQRNVDGAEKTLREAVSAVPENIDAKVQLVNLLYAQRGRDVAASELDQLIARQPDSDPLKLALGEVLVQMGLGERAEAMFRGVIAHAGKNSDGLSARDRLAALLMSRGDAAGSGALVAEVLKENGRDNDALIIRAELSMKSGDASSAIIDLRTVARDQPNSAAILRALARAYAANSEPEQAEETLRSAVQVAPNDGQAQLEFADQLVKVGKLDQANTMLEQLRKESPLNIAVEQALYRVQVMQKRNDEARATALSIEKSKPELGLGAYLLGMVNEADSKNGEAEQDYLRALKLQPTAIEPLQALVRLYVRLKEPAKATQLVDAAIARAPAEVGSYLLKGELLASQRLYSSAIASYREGIKVSPETAEAYHGLALVQVATGQQPDAVETLRLGIDKAGQAPLLINDLGSLYERMGQTDNAIALYDGVLKMTPHSTYAANNLAMLLVNYKQDDADLKRAQQLADQLASSSIVNVVDTRGWVKFKAGDYRAAETLLRQAVEQAPDRPEFHYHLGMAQLRSGEQQAAEQSLESALKSQRPFAGMDEAKSALALLKKNASVG
jgi:tetratricopeptide (TPR) repeat protein